MDLAAGRHPEPIGCIGYVAAVCDPLNATMRLSYASARGLIVLCAGDHESELWRAAMVVPVSVGAPRWPAGSARRQTSFTAGRALFWEPRGHGLTYTSCRACGKWNSLYARVAATLGTDPASIRRVLDDEWRW